MAAVCLAALFGGAGPGLTATAICAAGYPFVAELDVVAIPPGDLPVHAVRLALFLVVGLAQSLGAGALRRSQRESRRARLRSELRAERQRRARLRSAEQLEVLRAVTGDLAEGLCALDERGKLVFMNAAASRLLGWEEAELLGREFHALVHPRRASGTALPAAECPLLAPLRGGGASQGQNEVFVRRDGSTFPVSYTSSPIERGGKVIGAVLAFQDFSAHERCEQGERFLAEASRTLTESLDWEATLQRVAELAVPFLGDWCLVVLEQQGRPQSVAVAASDPERAEAARALLERYPIDPEAAHGVGRILRTGEPELLEDTSVECFVLEDGPDASLRAELLRRLGIHSYLGAPLVARGRTLGAIAFGRAEGPRRYGAEELALARDLAARCALALDNARLYREAREATRSREEVLAVVSHDLRAPLGAALLASQLLGRLVPAGAAPELQRAAETVRRATGRLARLVDDLVDFARLERGRLQIVRAVQDPAAIAGEALTMLEPLAVEQAVTLGLDAAPDLPPVSCDRHRILQVLANLLGNAVKVMPGGGAIRLSVRAAAGEVHFTVADTGPGIASEDVGRIFERYWRGQNPGYEGTGLGLAIARGVVEAHGGRIWVESAPRQGAAFTFSLPTGAPPPG